MTAVLLDDKDWHGLRPGPGGERVRARWCIAIHSAALAVLVLIGSGTAAAQGQPQWGIDRFPVRGLGGGEAATFRDLLKSEISQRNGVAFVDLGVECPDATCTMQAARQARLRYAVHASIGRLGRKVVVSFAAVDATRGQVLVSDTMSVGSVEELDTLAKRIASTIVDGRPVEQTAQLGEITKEEAKAPVRRDTRSGFSLGPEAIFPTRGYADEQFGVGLGVGLWFESMDFAIEPRLSYRTELSSGGEIYDHVALDLGVYYLMSRTDFSPLLGGGVGVHYLHEEVPVEHQVGTELRSSTSDIIDDSVAGVSGYLRAGMLLLRTYDVSVMLSVDYAINLADFQERSDEQALRISTSVIIGGT